MAKKLRDIFTDQIVGKKFLIMDPANKSLDGRKYEVLDLIERFSGITELEIRYENGEIDRKNLNYLFYTSVEAE